MNTGAWGAPPLLIAEGDQSLRSLFTDLLTEEGYELVFASSLEDAARLVDEQAFALVMVDLFVGRASLDLTRVRALRTRSYPVPLAVLTRLPLPAPVSQADCAFVLPLPFDIEACLSLIATTINAPLNAEQHAQAQVVQRLVEAIEAGDWEALVALHTEDVICVPPAHSRGTAARWVQGKAAFRSWAERLFDTYGQLRVRTSLLAATPRGLAARYTMSWQEREKPLQRAGTLFLRFQGERICQVGIRITLPPIVAEPGEPLAPAEMAHER